MMGMSPEQVAQYQAMLGGAPYAPPEPPKPQEVPPDPTKRDLVWGKAYPCLQIVSTGMHGQQCGGMMKRTHKRAYQFDHELWYHFKCNRCGREADDKKVRDAE